MSYEADVMSGLRQAIRDEFPSLRYDIRNMNKNNEKLTEALNENTRAQNISSLIRLCEVSMQRPELNIFTTAETIEIFQNIKAEIVGKEQTKEEPKSRRFFK